VDELERGEPSPEDGKEGLPGNEGLDTDAQIMGRLPRTRPQRRSERRPATATEQASATKSESSAQRRKRPRAPAAKASSARSAGRSQARGRPAQSATQAAARKRAAPGIPQLVFGAAVEAAKLPLKVTATVTRGATRLIGRGLRLR
jgi:hypothetical protein